jgi:dTDP-4-dehydrorhamnose reductase
MESYKKTLIFGKGFIGKELQHALGCNISDKKIFSFNDAAVEVEKYNPDRIINCIGYTGKSNVDDCEASKDKTLLANVFVPTILAEIALRYKLKLVHISSGCIYKYDYSKDKPITEDKSPDYFNLFYSRTKIYAEQILKCLVNIYPVLIARIRIPMDNKPHPKNIINKLIKYREVIDIPNSITYIPDFIETLRYLMKIDARGIYNIVNKGSLRYPRLLDVYRSYRTNFEYKIIDYQDLKLERTNLILSTKKLENSGVEVRDINEVLEECIRKYISC